MGPRTERGPQNPYLSVIPHHSPTTPLLPLPAPGLSGPIVSYPQSPMMSIPQGAQNFQILHFADFDPHVIVTFSFLIRSSVFPHALKHWDCAFLNSEMSDVDEISTALRLPLKFLCTSSFQLNCLFWKKISL